MAESFTPAMLSVQSLTLLVFALLASVVGGVIGYAAGRVCLPDPQLAFLTLIGCAFQNTVILPLGLISSLKVSWLQGEILDRAGAYVFVYSVMTSIVMWTVGQELIRHAGAVANGTHTPSTNGHTVRSAIGSIVKPLWSAPFIATLIGVAWGLAGLNETTGVMQYPVHAVFSATSVIGTACIPTSLILLGVNLRNSAGAVLGGGGAADSGEKPLCGRDLRVLVVSMLVTRLVVVPASLIACFHFIARPLFPELGNDPSLILVLFVESSAPTAIACSLLFTVHNFRPGAFAQSIFFQYLSVVVTAAAWLTFTLWYIESTTDVLLT
jgi:predicted permease